MATKTQRLKTIFETLRNAPVTNAEIDRAANAILRSYAPDLPADTPPEEKAGLVIRAIRNYLRAIVASIETEEAQRQAAAAITPPDYGND